MHLGNANLVRSLILLYCFGHVHNKRKTKTDNVDDISDLKSDIYLNSAQLLVKYGFEPTEHNVTTADGYIVTMFRIAKQGPPVLLVHGIGDSSDSWLVLGPGNSLAYQLSEAGYDVWMYNARGNKYSKGHVGTVSDKEYWNFSYEEMGTRDMPAVIDYILKTTTQDKLSYVGFSLGTTMFFIMCSIRPEYNQKINHAILLAPVAWINDIKYPFIGFFSENLMLVKSFFDGIGVYDAFSDNKLVNLFHAAACRIGSSKELLCSLEYYISYGLSDLRNLYTPKLPVLASHIPAGVSGKTFYHLFQSYAAKAFQRFDYGPEENRALYGSPQTPKYDMTLITAPVSLITSEVDWFSTHSDVQILTSKLPNIKRHILFNKTLDFSHLEFVYGARTQMLINRFVIDMLVEVNT